MKFNVRDLLWLMLVAAILMGWYVQRSVYLEREREIIKLRHRVQQLEAAKPAIRVLPIPPPGTRAHRGIQFDIKHSPKDRFDPFQPEYRRVD